MPIVFCGAPVVNSLVSMILHPPGGGLKAIPMPFMIGIVLAASGGFLVAKFAPTSAPGPAKPAATAEQKTAH
jgi:hypothetical protein